MKIEENNFFQYSYWNDARKTTNAGSCYCSVESLNVQEKKEAWKEETENKQDGTESILKWNANPIIQIWLLGHLEQILEEPLPGMLTIIPG